MPTVAYNDTDTYVTQATNTANVYTSVLDISPPSGTMLVFKNRVPQGRAPGMPVFMDLDTSAPADLSVGTSHVFMLLRPEWDRAQAVSIEESVLAPWNENTIANQRDEDVIDSVKVELTGSRVNVRDVDTLSLEVNSPDVVSWDDSELYIPRNAVEERPLAP